MTEMIESGIFELVSCLVCDECSTSQDCEVTEHFFLFISESWSLDTENCECSFELVQEKIPATLICDSMCAALMQSRGVDAVIVGADRIDLALLQDIKEVRRGRLTDYATARGVPHVADGSIWDVPCDISSPPRRPRVTSARWSQRAGAVAAALDVLRPVMTVVATGIAMGLEAIATQRGRPIADHPMVGDVRGLGLMAAVELVKDKQTKENYPASAKLADRLAQEFRARGLYTRVRGEVIMLAPPLMIPEDLLDRAVRIVGDTIDAVYSAVK